MTRKLFSTALYCLAVLLLLGACKGKQSNTTTDTTTTDSTQMPEDVYPKEVTLKAGRPQLINLDKFKWLAADCENTYTGVAKQLGSELLKLDNSKLKVLIDAKKLVATHLKKVSTEQADSLYPVYFTYANILLNAAAEDTYYNQLPQDYYTSYDNFDNLPLAYQPIMSELSSCGFRLLDIGEGMADLAFNSDYFYELFKPFATESITEYLRINAYEQEHLFCFDAGISITWEELANRTIPFENYVKQFPDSPYKDEMENNYRYYLNMLLMGLDNTPTFDCDDNGRTTIYPEMYDAYQATIKKHAGTRLAETLSAYCKLLKKEHMKYGEEVEAFVNKYTASLDPEDEYDG